MTMASPCFKPNPEYAVQPGELDRLKKLPLEMKVVYSLTKIQNFYVANNGKVFISFSGGKDSTVLMHLVRSKYPDIPAVFFDTGMEYPENRKFIKKFDNVEFIKPEMNFKEVIDRYGYPCISKEIAAWTGLAQKGYKRAIDRMNDEGMYGGKRYVWMIDAPFKVSADCCRIMKKKVSHQYYKSTGRCPIIGTRVEESRIRRKVFITHGDDHKSHGMPTLTPLSIWSEKDIEDYITINNLELSEAYTKLGCTRTGCMFCMFGIMNDKDRFLRLKKDHPAIWRQCMKPREEGGLGIKQVLDFMKIPTGCEQKNIEEFLGGSQ